MVCGLLASNNSYMLCLIQRVSRALVTVEDTVIGQIEAGLLALVGIEPADTQATCVRMAQRLLGYRVFSDAAGKMNLSVRDTGAGLLLVSQFTLAADTRSGMRPGFSTAAPPEHAQPCFAHLVDLCRQQHSGLVQTGRFGAHMQVSLTNDGPVTFLLRC